MLSVKYLRKKIYFILLCQLRHWCYGSLQSIQRGKLFPLQLCRVTGKKPLRKSIRARAARAFCGRDAFWAAIFRGSLVTGRNRCSRTSRIFRRLLCSSLTLHPERQCSQQPVATCIRTLHRAFVFSGSLSIDAGILIRLDKEGFNGSQIASLFLPLFFTFLHFVNLWAILCTVTVTRHS